MAIEIVEIGLRIGFGQLDLNHFAGDDRGVVELATDSCACFFAEVHPFGNDVAGSLQGLLIFGQAESDGLRHKLLGQRFVAFLSGYIGACLAVRLVGQIDILEHGSVPTIFNALLEFGRQCTLFLNGLEDSLLAFLQFLDALPFGLYISQLNLIQGTGSFLTVTRDERDGCALLEQGDDG